MIQIYKDGKFIALEGETLYDHTFNFLDRLYVNGSWYLCGGIEIPSVLTITSSGNSLVDGIYTEIENPWL